MCGRRPLDYDQVIIAKPIDGLIVTQRRCAIEHPSAWISRGEERQSSGTVAPRCITRQLSVMLHTRTLAVAAASSLVFENLVSSWLLRVSGSHVVSTRLIGDRAFNRGEISREFMQENYAKVLEKYKCKY